MTPEQQTAALLKYHHVIERLEKENMAMRESIKEASLQVSAFFGFYSDSLTISQMRFLSNGLAKLQLFLTEPKQ